MSRKPSEFRSDVVPWSQWVAEVIQLSKLLPDGLARLKDFSSAGGFCEEVMRADGGVAVLVIVPTARAEAFLASLRAAVAAGRAA